MSIDQSSAGCNSGPDGERRAKLAHARELMTAALALLDAVSRSPAAATLDLAVHHLDSELAN